jgi:hypothetical protein
VIRILPFVVELALVVYCLIDLWQADTARVRNLPKALWVLLIVLVPLVGGVAWLVLGRPQPLRGGGTPGYGPPRAPRGPDDDPDFLRGLGRRPPSDPDDSRGPDPR